MRVATLASLLALGCSSANFDVAARADAAVDSSDASADSPPPSAASCGGVADGTACGPADGTRRVCVRGGCLVSRCGDGFVDTNAGEVCDDGNTVAGDGCQPTCRYSCVGSADCDDKNACTAGERCDVETHRCIEGAPAAKGTPCTTSAGTAGQCNGTACAAPGCGNKLLDPGEECDDGNTIDDDGCRSDCRYTCKANADCDDGSVCTGTETCDVATHKCKPGQPLACDDGNACTSDTCVPTSGCRQTLIDADGDGDAPAALGSCGKDCNDKNPAISSKAAEVCDGVDNNCDGSIDEGLLKTCYADADGDGYGVASAVTKACACPPGTTARTDAFDCADGVAPANPGQTAFFTMPYSTTASTTSYDYDCNGLEQRQDLEIGACTLVTGACVLKNGWRTVEVPGCGMSQLYVTECKLMSAVCTTVTITKTQGCR